MQAFGEDERRAGLQPVHSSAHRQGGGFERFVDVGEVEGDLNDGFHTWGQSNATMGAVVTTKIM